MYFGLILILATWIAGAYLLTKWRDAGLSTISKHAASARGAFWLFASVLVGYGLALYVWLIKWFVPHLHLGSTFVAVLTVAILCLFLTVIVPDTHGWRRLVHRLSAFSMAVLFLPLAGLVVASPELSDVGKLICSIVALYMLITFILVAVWGKMKQRYLLFQALYIVSFQTLLLVAAYI